VGAHDRSGIAARPADRNQQIWRRGERDVFNSLPVQKQLATRLPLGSLRLQRSADRSSSASWSQSSFVRTKIAIGDLVDSDAALS
jgi:hypothetical protein